MVIYNPRRLISPAKHKLEILEFVGAGAATDIAIDALLTAATAGLGLVVAARGSTANVSYRRTWPVL